jgi:hypothetical protein
MTCTGQQQPVTYCVECEGRADPVLNVIQLYEKYGEIDPDEDEERPITVD